VPFCCQYEPIRATLANLSIISAFVGFSEFSARPDRLRTEVALIGLPLPQQYNKQHRQQPIQQQTTTMINSGN
jgi:hypothetical protein